MASRISHRSARNSCSRWRWIGSRASGTAAPARTRRMVMATINSISVKPEAEWPRRSKPRCGHGFPGTPPARCTIRAGLKLRISTTFYSIRNQAAPRLVNAHRSRCGTYLEGLVRSVARASAGDSQGRIPWRLGQESQGENRTLPGNSGCTWGAGRSHLQRAGRGVVAIHQRHGLTVTGEQSSVRDIHQLKCLWVVRELHGNRVNILSPAHGEVDRKG